MWWPWGKKKSTVRVNDKPSNFTSCSFKDAQKPFTEHSHPPAVKTTANAFHRLRISNALLRALVPTPPETKPDTIGKLPDSGTVKDRTISIPGADNRVVVYFTSLGAIRSTFENCKTVRSILRGFRVSVDERDLSMDSGFIEELKEILGQRKLTLPQVFLGGRYIGGVEKIGVLHETGELKKLVEGLPTAESGTCDVCGDFRFVLCSVCYGSCKLYSKKSGFTVCTVCNENGLISCSCCSSKPL